MNRVFVNQPSNQGGGNSDPLGPPGYFRLLMVHLGRPPLPLNILNYPKYVKDFDPDAHVRVSKVAIRTNSEIDDAKIVNMFNFTLINIVFDWCNNYLGD